MSEGACIGDFLDDERVVVDLDVGSRKRLFEEMAQLTARDGVDSDSVLHALMQREKLGCTAIGHGIALPHCRIEGFAEPVVAIARLKNELGYDAPDGAPVWLAVCLLVPPDAPRMHLRMLAELARRFDSAEFRERVLRARGAAELAACFRETPAHASGAAA